MTTEAAWQNAGNDKIHHQWRKRAVIVSRAAETVEFRHCHVPRKSKWFPKAQANFECSVSDLKAVHFTPRIKNNSAFLTVVTGTGKATIPDTGTEFAALRDWFRVAVPTNDPSFATDNPLVPLACVLVGTGCFFAAAFLAESAGTVAMGFAAVFGAVLGVLVTISVVHYGGKLFHTDLTHGIYAIPLGISIVAAVGFLYVDGIAFLSVSCILLGIIFATLLFRR